MVMGIVIMRVGVSASTKIESQALRFIRFPLCKVLALIAL